MSRGIGGGTDENMRNNSKVNAPQLIRKAIVKFVIGLLIPRRRQTAIFTASSHILRGKDGQDIYMESVVNSAAAVENFLSL